MDFSGGSKTSDAACQMQRQVMAILKVFGDDFSAETLSGNLENLEHNFIKVMLKTVQASTVKNYLLSFNSFVQFADVKNKDYIAHEVVERIGTQVSLWNRSLGKLILKRSHATKQRHQKDVITVEEVNEYLSGSRAEEAKEILNRYNKPSMCNVGVTANDHTVSRNYLIMALILRNATRTGPNY